jgi:RNA-binding protein
MTAIILSPAQRREYRASAHHLDPVVLMGNDGLTEGVVREVDGALKAHGLIKVRVPGVDKATRDSLGQTLCDRLDAGLVQAIGKLVVLWRPLPNRVTVPKDDRGAGPKLVKLVKFSKSGNHRPQIKTVKVLGNERIAAGGVLKRARKRTTRTDTKKSATGGDRR